MKNKKPPTHLRTVGNNGNGNGNGQDPGNGAESQVVDLGAVRSRRNQEERRKAERFFLREVVQFFALASADGKPDGQTVPVEVLEASESGCSFRIPQSKEDAIPANQDELYMRIYFSADTYLYLRFRIVSRNQGMDQGQRFIRFGCEVDPSFASHQAYVQFVRFVEAFIATSQRGVRQTHAGA